MRSEGKWMQLEDIMLNKPGSKRQSPHVFSQYMEVRSKR
jgi:hypothetical protein